jgi:hypothetical protein
MTTVISRLYSDRATAEGVAHALVSAGLSSSAIVLADSADGLGHARLSKASAAAYAAAMGGGRVLLVAHVPFNPVGAARRAAEIADTAMSLNVPGAKGNEYVREKATGTAYLHILKDHPRFFSQDMGFIDSRVRGLVSHAFGFRVLSPSRERTSAAGRSGHILPGSKLTAARPRTSAIRGGWKFSDMIGWRTTSRAS